jgi:hypothetical protein
MERDLDSFDPFEDNYEYSHMGRNFGSAPINAIMHGLFPRHLLPKPRNGQDMYDSLIQRERSQHFMNLQSSSFSNNMLNQAMGISGPAAAMVGRMAGSPDGALARMLSPLIGGNPMAASMQTYASLSGASTMGAFGRLSSISEEETQKVMNALSNNFYKTQKFEGKGGIAEELNTKNQKFLNELIDKNDEDSIRHLRDSGIFPETEGKGKKEKIKNPSELKRKIANLDFTSGFREGEAEEIQKAQITSGLGRDMARLLTETDDKVKAALEERMEKIFKATGVTISGHVKSAPSTAEKTAARRDLAADLFKSLDDLKAAPEKEKDEISKKVKQQFRDLGMTEQAISKISDDKGTVSFDAASKLAEDFVLRGDDADKNRNTAARRERASAIFKSLEALKTAPEEEKEKLSNEVKQQFRELGISEQTVNKIADDKGTVSFENASKLAEDFVLRGAPSADKNAERREQASELFKSIEALKTAPEAEKQKISEQVKQQFLELGVKEQAVNKIADDKGTVSFNAASKLAEDFVLRGSAANNQDKTAERRERASELFKSIEALKAAPEAEKQKISEQVKQQFRDLGIRETPIKQLTDGKGTVSVDAARNLAEDFVMGRTPVSMAEKAEARKDLASELFKSIDALKAAPAQDKSKISDQIKQQFRDLGMSEQRIQKISDKDGIVSVDTARKLTEDFASGKTDFVEKESKESTMARDAVASKSVRKTKILNLINEASEQFQESTDTSKDGEEKNKKAKEKFQADNKRAFKQLQSETMQALGINEDEYARRYLDKDKNVMMDKLKSDVEKSTQLNSSESARLAADTFGASGFRRKGINFENTRGFNVEDFTSAFSKAADLRMLGDARGKSPEEMMDAFSKNAGGVMAAARSLFGNKSGGELMQNSRDLMGLTSMNLSTEDGAKDVEDMLRKVKSTARVAGLSVKHMLGIIEATRDLARSNPQLQNMNQGSLTNLAVASTMHAASAGARMSAADFTSAGGGQGIMAAESKSSLAFAQSSTGSLMAVALGQAKARGKEKEMLKLIDEGKFEASALARGSYSEIASVAGVTTGALTYMANDPAVAQRYFKDKSISDTVTGARGDKLIADTMTRVIARGVFGKSGQQEKLAELYKKSKEEGMTDSEFETKYIDPNLNTAQRAAFQTHKVKFFRQMRDKNLPEPVKNALTKIRDADMEASSRTSKAMEGKTGSLASQAISAILNNEGMDNIADAFVGMFATNGDARSKDLNQKAQDAAKGLYDSIRDKGKGSEKERLDRIDVKDSNGVSDLDRLNSVIDAQKDQAMQTGDTERASKLQRLTKKDIVALQGSSGETTIEGAKARLKELKARADKGEVFTAEIQQQYETLQAQEKITGGFTNQQAYEAVSSKKLSGMLGGIMQGGKASAEKAAVEERKKVAYTTMESQLTELAKTDQSFAAAQDYYKDKGGARQLAQDFQEGKGMFADKATREKYQRNGLSSIVDTTTSVIAEEEKRIKGSGEAPPAEDAATAGFKSALAPILEAIKGSDSLKVAIEKLTAAIGAF